MEEEKCVLVTICSIISYLANVNRTVILSSHNISIYGGVFFKSKDTSSQKSNRKLSQKKIQQKTASDTL